VFKAAGEMKEDISTLFIQLSHKNYHFAGQRIVLEAPLRFRGKDLALAKRVSQSVGSGFTVTSLSGCGLEKHNKTGNMVHPRSIFGFHGLLSSLPKE
jgi:hypothetical protein